MLSKRSFGSITLAAAVVLFTAGSSLAQQQATAPQPVRVGIGATASPFTLFSNETATGATVEIVQAIAKGAGLSIVWVPISGAGSNPVLAAFDAGQIDLNAYPFQMTEARRAQFDFTDPIFVYGEVVVVNRNDQRPYTSVADLMRRSVGVVAASAFVDIANRAGANTRVVDSLDMGLDEVNTGRLDALMGTAPVVIALVSLGLRPDVRIPSEYRSDSPFPAGFQVKKGNAALLATLNTSLAKLRADGTIRAIAARWGVAGLIAP